MTGPAAPAPDGPGPSRRDVVEGLAVALLAGVGGFAWFSASGPPSESEREELEDQRDEKQDELEDQQDDEQDGDEDRQDDEQDDDEDRSGPDRGRG